MKKVNKYPTPKRIRSGKNLFVVDYDNKTLLAGLSWDSGNGQYYYTFWQSEKDVQIGKKTRKDYSFGVDYQDAVFRFKQWKKDTHKFALSIPTNEVEVTEELSDNIPHGEKHKTADINKEIEVLLLSLNEKIKSRTFTERDSVLPKLVDLLEIHTPYVQTNITADKKHALYILRQLLQDDELRIEAIRLLKLGDLLPREFKRLAMKDILQFYQDHNTCSKKEKGQIKTAVNHFIKVIQKKHINDVVEEDLELFRDTIKNSNKSDTYKEGRLNRVKTVLNYYLENKSSNGEKELVRNILILCKEKFKTCAPTPDETPKSIDLEILKKIFTEARRDREIYLMLVLMLNTAFYPIDIRQLKKSMITTKDKITYIIHRRTKTKQTYIRVNCLWSLTAKLLKKQCNLHPDSPYVFLNEKGGPYAEGTLGKKFKLFFNYFFHEDGSPVSAKHFRDTVASALAFDVHPNIIKITMGHSIKTTKDEFWKYVENRPEQQKPAIDVLYNKFRSAFKSK